jgi:hypothetical protein
MTGEKACMNAAYSAEEACSFEFAFLRPMGSNRCAWQFLKMALAASPDMSSFEVFVDKIN